MPDRAFTQTRGRLRCRIGQPTLLVHSDGCALPDNAKAVHARLAGKKRLDWIDTATQTDFYDVPEYVKTAADRAAAWFGETL